MHGIHRPRLLITGGKVARGQGPSLAQALIYHMEHLPVHTLDVSTLFSESARSPEETCVQVLKKIIFSFIIFNLKSLITVFCLNKKHCIFRRCLAKQHDACRQ